MCEDVESITLLLLGGASGVAEYTLRMGDAPSVTYVGRDDGCSVESTDILDGEAEEVCTIAEGLRGCRGIYNTDWELCIRYSNGDESLASGAGDSGEVEALIDRMMNMSARGMDEADI